MKNDPPKRRPRPIQQVVFTEKLLATCQPAASTVARTRADRQQLHNGFTYNLISDLALEHRRSKTVLQLRVLPTLPIERSLLVRVRNGKMARGGPLQACKVGEMPLAAARGLAVTCWFAAIFRPDFDSEALFRLCKWYQRAATSRFFPAGVPPITLGDLRNWQILKPDEFRDTFPRLRFDQLYTDLAAMPDHRALLIEAVGSGLRLRSIG